MKNKKKMRRFLHIFSVLLFVGCVGFLIYYLGIQPYLSRKVTNKYRDIYYASENIPNTLTEEDSNSNANSDNKKEKQTKASFTLDSAYEKGAKDSNGVLLKFSKLLDFNKDVKGWLSIKGTDIDYPVLQSKKDADYYLTRDFEGNTDKNGSLFIDEHCAINKKAKKTSKNIVIHGHNMETTKMMFFDLPKYKDIEFYKKHPVITFDSIYSESKWKIISFMRVSGNTGSNGGFDYMQGDFETDEDFLNFVYQIEMRSLYRCPVDINESDSLLMLSTCSYEVDNYRTVVVARKVRKDESAKVDTTLATMRKDVLYPQKWYDKYGGEPPVNTFFMEAMSFDEIDWYDGALEADEAIGKVVAVDDFEYEITSKTTVSYSGSTNKKLTYLEIPSTVEIDGRKYDVTGISKKAFSDMKKLTELKIGNNVTEIKSKTFTNCSKLESVIIGDSVTSIGNKAFYNLKNLNYIKLRSLKLTEIGEKAFKGIAEKAKVKLPENKEKKYSKLLKECGITDKIKIKTYKSEDDAKK